MLLAPVGNTRLFRRAVVAGLVLLVVSGSAAAAPRVLTAFNTGLYTSDGEFRSPSFLSGISLFFAGESRGYLVFDLSAIGANERVKSATLRVPNEASLNQVGPDDPLVVWVHGLPGAHAGNFGYSGTLNANNFAYIGSGLTPGYAKKALVPADLNSVVSMKINAAGVADLNARVGSAFYAYGFKVQKADVQEPKPLQFVFENSDMPDAPVELVLEVCTKHPTKPGKCLK